MAQRALEAAPRARVERDDSDSLPRPRRPMRGKLLDDVSKIKFYDVVVIDQIGCDPLGQHVIQRQVPESRGLRNAQALRDVRGNDPQLHRCRLPVEHHQAEPQDSRAGGKSDEARQVIESLRVLFVRLHQNALAIPPSVVYVRRFANQRKRGAPGGKQHSTCAAQRVPQRNGTRGKVIGGSGAINGGYFILNRRALDYIDGDDAIWERDPVEQIAQDGELIGYQHYGFWSCMDTLKEKNMLEELWNSGKAPWKIW